MKHRTRVKKTKKASSTKEKKSSYTDKAVKATSKSALEVMSEGVRASKHTNPFSGVYAQLSKNRR
jgi:hypothetical protein